MQFESFILFWFVCSFYKIDVRDLIWKNAVVITDDRPIVRLAVKTYLERDESYQFAEEAENGIELV